MNPPVPIADVQRVAALPEFRAAAGELLARLDARIAARAPVCTNRGACCRFGAYGHDLFVTAAELAWFIATAPAPLLAPPDRSYCPYQQGGACVVRTARPAGCRIYFCDAGAQHWQPDESEAVIREFAALGERFGLPYAYVEWTDALRQMGGAIVPEGAVAPPASPIPLRIAIDSHEGPS